MGKCCIVFREVLWGSVSGKCCEEVLWSSVLKECCEGVVAGEVL